jgi:hypothetical protein
LPFSICVNPRNLRTVFTFPAVSTTLPAMTLQQTVTIPADRRLHLDWTLPETASVGAATVTLKFPAERTAAVWEQAALLAQEEYQDNKELTAFSTLDGEAFL